MVEVDIVTVAISEGQNAFMLKEAIWLGILMNA